MSMFINGGKERPIESNLKGWVSRLRRRDGINKNTNQGKIVFAP